jgi:hypothetical protein
MKKTPLNFTPLSTMDDNSLFSPSAFGFTPARIPTSGAPKIDDEDMMKSSIVPTPSKPGASPRMDLNLELNYRSVKDTPLNSKCKMESYSPDWATAVS